MFTSCHVLASADGLRIVEQQVCSVVSVVGAVVKGTRPTATFAGRVSMPKNGEKKKDLMSTQAHLKQMRASSVWQIAQSC